MILTIGIGIGALVVGFVTGALVYRNNAKKIEREAKSRILELKLEVDRLSRIVSQRK